MILNIIYLDGKTEQLQCESFEKSDYWIIAHCGGRYCKDDRYLSGYNIRSFQVSP